MLSPMTASETRRKTHRRQNSTPVTEAPYTPPKLPAAINRSNGQKRMLHRRGLSMDTAIPQTTNRMIQPTLQPVPQDDATVSIDNSGQRPPQQQLQFAQQHELVQPGHPNFQHLQLQTDFSFPQQPQLFSPQPQSAPAIQLE